MPNDTHFNPPGNGENNEPNYNPVTRGEEDVPATDILDDIPVPEPPTPLYNPITSEFEPEEDQDDE